MPGTRTAHHDKKACKKIKVLTYNVWFDPTDYVARAALLFNIIREKDPDVVALQEVTGCFLEILRNDPMVVSEGNAVASELVDGICSGVSISKVTPDSCPSPSPKRQIRTWDFDGRADNEAMSQNFSDCRMHTDFERTSSGSMLFEPQYTLIVEPDLGPLKKYGTALLTKECPSAMLHQVFEAGDMDRSLMAVELSLFHETSVWFATAHLESAEGAGGLDNHFVRKDQMTDALAILGRDACCCPVVFMGDMNPTRKCEAEWVAAPWEDAWLRLRPLEPGYTKDCLANPHASSRTRTDKVLYRDALLPPRHPGQHDAPRTAALTPTAIAIVGQPACIAPAEHDPDFDPMCTPEPPSRPQIVPSDHFGLCCEFDLALRPASG